MTHQTNQADPVFNWHDILWRILVTIFLLMLLAITSITIFHDVTTRPDAYVLPALPYAVTIQ
jgi:hypothetical protein